MGAEVSEIFKAAQYLSRKDREEVVLERKKNLKFLDFISAHGLSITDFNEFVESGKISSSGNAQKVFGQGPVSMSAPQTLVSDSFANPSFLGCCLAPVSCVGEASIPVLAPQTAIATECAFQSPSLAPLVDGTTSGPGSDNQLSNSNSKFKLPCSPPKEGELPRHSPGPLSPGVTLFPKRLVMLACSSRFTRLLLKGITFLLSHQLRSC